LTKEIRTTDIFILLDKHNCRSIAEFSFSETTEEQIADFSFLRTYYTDCQKPLFATAAWRSSLDFPLSMLCTPPLHTFLSSFQMLQLKDDGVSSPPVS
jgi:hypothetical protein